MSTGKLVDKAVLKTLVPPSALNAENFQELAGKAFVEELPAGKVVFSPGDIDRKTTYLLEGQMVITDKDGKEQKLTGGSDAAKHPLANHQPRKHTAKTVSACKITRFDSDLLDILLTWDQLSGIEVSEIQVDEEEEAAATAAPTPTAEADASAESASADSDDQSAIGGEGAEGDRDVVVDVEAEHREITLCSAFLARSGAVHLFEFGHLLGRDERIDGTRLDQH